MLESYIAGLLNNRDSLKEINCLELGNILFSKWRKTISYLQINELSLLKKTGDFHFYRALFINHYLCIIGILVILLSLQGN